MNFKKRISSVELSFCTDFQTFGTTFELPAIDYIYVYIFVRNVSSTEEMRFLKFKFAPKKISWRINFEILAPDLNSPRSITHMCRLLHMVLWRRP